MHRTLKLMRAGEDQAAERAPQPGLADLAVLLERSRAAGVRVELAVEGDPRPLSQSVDLSAFRILQEALTNVVKHAGRAHATVLLGYRAHALELIVTDTGDGAAAPSPRAATASSACASAPRYSAAALPRARAATTASRSTRSCPTAEGRPHELAARCDRRRPADDARRLQGGARGDWEHRRRRRGRQRRGSGRGRDGTCAGREH